MTAIIFALFLTIFTQSQAAPPKKIVGGHDAIINEFPYVVSVRYYGDHICGGVFITKQHILTAAHCVQHEDDYTGKAKLIPTYYLTVASGGTDNVRIKNLNQVENYFIHPNYEGSKTQHVNDIAVIKLTKEIVEDDTQKVIKLPSTYTESKATGYVVGWGKQGENIVEPSPTLKKVALWTISNAECSLIAPKPVVPQQLCANYNPGLGFCDGDSGGPMIVNDEVVGIVSMAYGCGRGFGDIFTRVQSYNTWINEQLK